MRRAVIDVGSNSVLLTVCENQANEWVPIYETSAVSGLGEGVKKTGILSSASIQRTLGLIKKAFEDAQLKRADVKAYGTMALRIAQNANDFLELAEKQNTTVKILSDENEAKLSLFSVCDDNAFNAHDCITVIDVGGNSTEIATCKRGNNHFETVFEKSFPCGTLTLRDHLPEKLDAPKLLNASQKIDDTLQMRYLPNQCGVVVALGASATNLITIRDRIINWDPNKVHAKIISYEEISKMAGWMSKMNDNQRAQLQGLEKGRERTIHLGALLLERALFSVGAEYCYVSVRGWRHAIITRWNEF